MRTRSKGQMTIIGIMATVVFFLVFAGFLPTLNGIIGTASASADSTTQLALAIVIPFIAFSGLIMMMAYAFVSRAG